MSTTVPEPVRLRLWPAVLIVAVAAVLAVGVPQWKTREMSHFLAQIGGPVLGSLAVLVWWLTASRSPRRDRWPPVILFMVPAIAIGAAFYRGAAMNLIAFGVPFVAVLWVAYLLATRGVAWPARRAGLLATVLLGWAAFALVRIDQTDAEVRPELRWAWNPTAEQRYLAERAARLQTPATTAAAPVVVTPGDWAEFRGPNRDGRLGGVSIGTDWERHPPKLVWKQRIGPGWGTFAVVGDRLFTQEQHGEEEAVVCYDAGTGTVVWEHAEPARFYEGIAGAGPRATPTVRDGKVYAQGATGDLACLDAATGTPVWKTDIRAGTGGVVPQWGYASSPLVTHGLVVVYCGGPGGKGTAAFRADTGALAWAAGGATHGYSSGQLATLAGVEQVLMASDFGLEAFRPADGHRLWAHEWPNKGGNRSTQPTVLDGDSVLVGTGAGTDLGTRRLKVSGNPTDGYRAEVAWVTRKLKPYFNDGVVHDGHCYGFNDKNFVCIDLSDGRQKWDAGPRYGFGQVLLLADQGVLVVQAVDGKVALVAASPDGHDELATFQAIQGKTWNHPVVARGRLYVRNGEEAACYELPPK